MSGTMTLPNPVIPTEHRCKLEDVFDENFIELIELVPRNPHVRALILKLTRKMPGPQCQTFEQLKEWVEMNCEKRTRTPQGRSARAAEDGIAISVEFSETEYGRANYSVRRSGSEAFRLDAWDLLEMIQTAIADGEGMEEIVERVAEKIDDDAWDQCDPSMDYYGDYDYDQHEADDTGDSETSYSKNDIRNRVLAFVRERHPELAAEL